MKIEISKEKMEIVFNLINGANWAGAIAEQAVELKGIFNPEKFKDEDVSKG